MSDVERALQAPRGTRDVLWPETDRWERVVGTFADLVQRAGYGLILNPMFEHAAVFRRGHGEGSDAVGKEMYEFEDRDGTMLALRPEGTASVVRAYVQHRPDLPWKAWYATPAFRHERPQAGRYRQHHQVGIEVMGVEDADADVEVISLAADFFSSLGLRTHQLSLGTLGDLNCRPAYVATLQEYLRKQKERLCPEHVGRIETQPLRILDCKREECRLVAGDAPRLADALCEPCHAHFSRVQEGLVSLGIEFFVDPRLVRGWDYYARTTFEFSSQAMEAAQNGIGGGGRYDGLVELLGGPSTPGVGFGIGIERVLLAADAEGVLSEGPKPLDAFVVDLTDGSQGRDLCALLRRNGWGVDRAFDGRSMKSQMKAADRSGARFAVIVGPGEIESDTLTLRPLRGNGEQRSIPRSELLTELQTISTVENNKRKAEQ
jgi:histidyl-tRNA synthetase